MARQGTRRTLAHGIYEDGSGYEAQVNGGRGPGNSKRFRKSEDPKADVREMKRWQLRRETLLAQQGDTAPMRADCLKADVPVFLATLREGRRRLDAEVELRRWLVTQDGRATAIATMARHDITTMLLLTERERLLTDGYANDSVNHSVSRLRALYNTLDKDTPDAPNPTLKIEKLESRTPEPRDIPLDFIEAAFDSMPKRGRGVKDQKRSKVNKTKLRLRLMVETGWPPKIIMQLDPALVRWDLDPVEVWTRPRRKGKGTKGGWTPVPAEAVPALRAFFEHGATGPFSTSSAAKVFHRAIARTQRAWEKQGRPLPVLPQNVHPYDLRHTFLTNFYATTRSKAATAAAGLHADPRTTDRYIVGAVDAVQRQALADYNRGRRAAVRKARSASRGWNQSAGTGKTRKNVRKTA